MEQGSGDTQGWGGWDNWTPSLEHDGETFKIQILAGHVTLRDTEAVGLSRMDK